MDDEKSHSRRNRIRDDPMKLVGVQSEGGQDEDVDEFGVDDLETEVEKSRVLIREAASFENFHALDDPHSLESEIARSRGGVEVLDYSEGGVVARFEEGRIQVDEGYVMRFVGSEVVPLPVYDICALPDTQWYPVPESVIDGLPETLWSKLRKKGHVKFSGVYDQSAKEFYSIDPGWGDLLENPADVLVEIFKEIGDRSVARSVYFFLYHYASDEYGSVESIARLRDIEESSVDSEVRQAREMLDTDEFRFDGLDSSVEPGDLFGEVYESVDGDRLMCVVYYFLYRYASDQYSDPLSIAEMRGVEPSQVMDQIWQVEKEIDESVGR